MISRNVLRGAAAALLVFCVTAPSPALAILHPGDLAPDFHKTDLDGVPRTLFQYRGKVVFLFLLASG